MQPMLATSYKRPDEFPVFAQPKLNGIRCLASAAGLLTRTGNPITTASHIVAALAPLFRLHPAAVLDGELYDHGLRDDFGKTLSLFQTGATPALGFHVYDLPSENVDFARRNQRLHAILAGCHAPIFEVQTVPCRGQKELDRHYRRQIEQGYEGQMVRAAHWPYEPVRSRGLMKRKTFKDGEFAVAHSAAGATKSVTCRTRGGGEFEARLDRDWIAGAAILQRLAGFTEATLRYADVTPDGLPLDPVVIALHATARDY